MVYEPSNGAVYRNAASEEELPPKPHEALPMTLGAPTVLPLTRTGIALPKSVTEHGTVGVAVLLGVCVGTCVAVSVGVGVGVSVGGRVGVWVGNGVADSVGCAVGVSGGVSVGVGVGDGGRVLVGVGGQGSKETTSCGRWALLPLLSEASWNSRFPEPSEASLISQP